MTLLLHATLFVHFIPVLLSFLSFNLYFLNYYLSSTNKSAIIYLTLFPLGHISTVSYQSPIVTEHYSQITPQIINS